VAFVALVECSQNQGLSALRSKQFVKSRSLLSTYIEHKWFKITDYQAFKILNASIILIDNQ